MMLAVYCVAVVQVQVNVFVFVLVYLSDRFSNSQQVYFASITEDTAGLRRCG